MMAVIRPIAVLMLVLLVLPVQSMILVQQAVAQQSYVLSVVDISENPGPDVLDAVARLVEAFTEHPQVEYRKLDRLLDAGGHETEYGNAVAVRQSLKAGRAAFQEGNYAQALENLENGSFLISSSFGFLGSQEMITDTLLYLAASRYEVAAGGEEDASGTDARDTLLDLLIKFPDLIYPSVRFSDGFNALVDEVRDSLKTRPRGELRIDTDSGLPGRAYVDGVYRGITPLTVFNLIAGQHYVGVLAQGYAVAQSLADVGGAASGSVSLTLQPAKRASILEHMLPGLRADLGRSTSDTKTISDLKGLLFTDYVVLVDAATSAAGTEIHAGLFNLVSGSRIRTDRAVMKENPAKTAREIVRRLLIVEKIEPVRSVTVEDNGRGIAHKWWFWTIIGVAVAGGITVGVIAASSGGGGGSGFRKDGTGAVLVHF